MTVSFGIVNESLLVVGKKREENEETLVPKKVTDNKYQLQMASWKGVSIPINDGYRLSGWNVLYGRKL